VNFRGMWGYVGILRASVPSFSLSVVRPRRVRNRRLKADDRNKQ
jgi:hypothetical protein